MSASSSFAALPAFAIWCAVRSAFPIAVPIFTAASVSLLFLAISNLLLNNVILSTPSGPVNRLISLSSRRKEPDPGCGSHPTHLPLRPGLPERQTHDYERHGTTTLFAALNVLEGTVIGHCQPRHRHQEFVRFLDRIDQSVDTDLDIHLVLDNYGTHKHPEVKKWLTARPRYHVHFTPTSSSWLNQIERWFAEIT